MNVYAASWKARRGNQPGRESTAPIASPVKTGLTAISSKNGCDVKAVIRYMSVPEEVTYTAITLPFFFKSSLPFTSCSDIKFLHLQNQVSN